MWATLFPVLVSIMIHKEYGDCMEMGKWRLLKQEEFFAKNDVIESLKVRFRDYLNSKNS